MSEPTQADLKKTLKEADKQGLSDQVESSIEARLGAQPTEEE